MSHLNHEPFNAKPNGKKCDGCGKKTYDIDRFVIPKEQEEKT